MINPIPVTTLIAGVLAVAQVPLTILVSYLRGRTGIQFLDGGNETLLRRIRAHANFVETVPITLVAMACAEFSGASSAVLWRGGVCLLLGRAIHVWAALNPRGWGLPRIVAMVLTFYAMAGFGIVCIRAAVIAP
jgi:uncharacterized membrane protein YecN with MAPEG domain